MFTTVHSLCSMLCSPSVQYCAVGVFTTVQSVCSMLCSPGVQYSVLDKCQTFWDNLS